MYAGAANIALARRPEGRKEFCYGNGVVLAGLGCAMMAQGLRK